MEFSLKWLRNRACYGFVIAICIVSSVSVISFAPQHLQLDELRIFLNILNLRMRQYQPKIDRNGGLFSLNLNETHLWSFELADDQYFRIANSIPCRQIDYVISEHKNPLDTCDHSENSEFSRRTTFQIQKWLFEHQNPVNCTNKRFAIINNYPLSGIGSTLHQIVAAFAKAIEADRIAVYATPGNWMYGDCELGNPDCFFLPISNCTAPKTIDGVQAVSIDAVFGGWTRSVGLNSFKNKTFNWYRSQLIFYLTRYNNRTMNHVLNSLMKNLHSLSLSVYRPYAAIFVRRSDKVQSREMARAFALSDYFNLLDNDTRRLNITTIYLNSEEPKVFEEFSSLNNAMGNRYKLLKIDMKRNVVFHTLMSMSQKQRGEIILDFLTDLFIEVHADLHSGTLSSNWCRLVDELRLVLGKTIPFYTPEKQFFMEA